jgi:hypothetical protein
VLATSHYGEDFVAAVCKGAAMATQFHPEKSGLTGQCLGGVGCVWTLVCVLTREMYVCGGGRGARIVVLLMGV